MPIAQGDRNVCCSTDITGEILGQENTATAEEVKKCIRIQMLPFAAEPQRVAARHPAQRVANLITVEFRALGDAEVGPILQARESNLVPRCQSRWIRDRVVRAERGYGVQEPVPVENKAVGQAR